MTTATATRTVIKQLLVCTLRTAAMLVVKNKSISLLWELNFIFMYKNCIFMHIKGLDFLGRSRDEENMAKRSLRAMSPVSRSLLHSRY